MSRILSVAFGLLFLIDTFGQSKILEIKDSKEAIKGRMSLLRFEQDKEQEEKITAILSLDIFKYYNLEKTYDSDLKKKLFKESGDYKEKLANLTKDRQTLLSKDHYIDFEPDYYEKNNLLKYNLTTKTFSLTNEIYFYEKNKNSYLQFGKLVLSPLQGISIKYSDFSSGGVRFSRGIIQFKILDESNALKIEENKANLKMLFVFGMINTTEFTNNLLDAWTFKDYLINCKLKSVIVYNSETNEIYWEYY